MPALFLSQIIRRADYSLLLLLLHLANQYLFLNTRVREGKP